MERKFWEQLIRAYFIQLMKDAVGYYAITNFDGMKKNIITFMMLILVMEFFYVVY